MVKMERIFIKRFTPSPIIKSKADLATALLTPVLSSWPVVLDYIQGCRQALCLSLYVSQKSSGNGIDTYIYIYIYPYRYQFSVKDTFRCLYKYKDGMGGTIPT